MSDIRPNEVEAKNFVDHLEDEGHIDWSGSSNSSAMWPEPFHFHNLDKLRPPLSLDAFHYLIPASDISWHDDMDDG